MIYGSIVKSRIRQSFDHVNNHRWDALMGSIAPSVHHQFLGAHAIGGERHGIGEAILRARHETDNGRACLLEFITSAETAFSHRRGALE